MSGINLDDPSLNSDEAPMIGNSPHETMPLLADKPKRAVSMASSWHGRSYDS